MTVASALTIATTGEAIKLISPIVVLVLGILCWRQSGIYADEETLYRSTPASNPNSWMAHHNVAKLLAKKPGGLVQAIAEHEALLRVYPDFAETHSNLGNALAQIPGRLPDAAREPEKSVHLDPQDAHGRYNLANILRISGRMPEAVREY